MRRADMAAAPARTAWNARAAALGCGPDEPARRVHIAQPEPKDPMQPLRPTHSDAAHDLSSTDHSARRPGAAVLGLARRIRRGPGAGRPGAPRRG